jgi:hypothetical protein
MLGAKCTNYVPAAIDAGLMPLLASMLAETNADCNARSAVMRCLRLITSRSNGVRTVNEADGLHQTVLDACVKSVHEWCHSRNDAKSESLSNVIVVGLNGTLSSCLDSNRKAALRAATDALHIAASMWTTGTSTSHFHCSKTA